MTSAMRIGVKLEECHKKMCPAEFEAGQRQNEMVKAEMSKMLVELQQKKISLQKFIARATELKEAIMESKETANLRQCSVLKCRKHMIALVLAICEDMPDACPPDIINKVHDYSPEELESAIKMLMRNVLQRSANPQVTTTTKKKKPTVTTTKKKPTVATKKKKE